MSSVLALTACILFCTGMVHATVTDLQCRRIRNWLMAALALAWAPLSLAAGVPLTEMAAAFGMAALVFAGGFACFAAGWLGGGDVKLASVAVLWLGAHQAAAFVLLASVLGAVLATLLLAARGRAGFRRPVPGATPTRGVPYGPALAAAGLILLRGSPLAAPL